MDIKRIIKYLKNDQPSGHFCKHQVASVQQFYVDPT